MRVNLNAVTPEWQHPFNHILPRNFAGKTDLAIEVTREIQPQSHRWIRSVIHKFNAVYGESIRGFVIHEFVKAKKVIPELLS